MKYVLLMIVGYVLYGAGIALLVVAMFTRPIPKVLALTGMFFGFGAMILTTLKMDLLGDIFKWAIEKEKKQRGNE